MDTSTKRNVRATLSELYDARVAETTEKVDPNRAKANAALKDADNLEIEPLSGQLGAYKDPLPEENTSYLDSPLLTLWELMPGSTGSLKEDTDLDQSFRADRIEFMVVQRPLTASEAQESGVIEDPGDVDWDIPTPEQYEDIVGHLFDVFTDDDSNLIHAFRWSSVGSATGVGLSLIHI